MTQQGGGRTGWARADPVRVGVSLSARPGNLPSRPVGTSLPAPARSRQASDAPPRAPADELDQLRREFHRRLGSDSDDEIEAFVSQTQQRFQQMLSGSGFQSMQGMQGMQGMPGIQGMQDLQGMQGLQEMKGMQGMRLGRDDPFRGMGSAPGDAGGALTLNKARLAAAKDRPTPPLKDSGSPLRVGGPSLLNKHPALLDSPTSLLDGPSLLGGRSLLSADRLSRLAENGRMSDALVSRAAAGPLAAPSRLPAGVQHTFQSSSTSSSTMVTSSGGRGQPSVTRVTRQQQQEHTHSDGAAVRQQRAQQTEAATVTQRGGQTHVNAQQQQTSHNRAVRLRSGGAAEVTEEVAASGGTRRGVFEASKDGPRQISMSGNDFNVRAQLGMRQSAGGAGDGQLVPLEGVSGPLWRFFDAGPLIQPPGTRLKYKINVQASHSSFSCRDGALPRFTGNQIAFEDSYGSESESDDDDDTPALQGGSRSNQLHLGWSSKPALPDSPRSAQRQLGWSNKPALPDSPRSAQRQLGWSKKPALPWRPGQRADSQEPLPKLEITELPPDEPLRRHEPLRRLAGAGSAAGAAPGAAPGAAVAPLPWRSAVRPPSLAPSEAPSVDSEGDVEPGEVGSDQVERQRRERLRKIATELLTTERKYVRELHLIDQLFRRRVEEENRVQHMFNNDVATQMFVNVQSIHQFHREHLLPELEARLADWDSNPRIGDIMKKSAPFLKMYTEYVSGYSNAMNLINTYQQKCPKFAGIMDSIHEMEECVNLPLQHHIIVPVQRVPRYELMLKDYLQKLAADSPDRADAQRALELVTLAARHSNDTMKRVDKFKQLLEIQENISGGPDLVSPTRELLKEGKICKISARSGDHQERYLFLFSDLLLLCSARLINKRIISGPAFRLRAKFSVEGLQVLEGDNLETLNTFYISGSNKNVELYTQTAEEKAEWLEALSRVVTDFYERRSSLKGPGINSEPQQLGQRAPPLASVDSVSRCTACDAPFSVMKRKHNCHACGDVVCSKCSGNKAPLPCEGGRPSRVCDRCYRQLTSQKSDTSAPGGRRESVLDATYRRGKGALHVAASEPSLQCGELQLRCRRAWVRRWFCLRANCVLYMYSSADGVTALAATPVPGFTVTWAGSGRTDLGVADKEKERAFRLALAKRSYTFLTDGKEELGRWIAALQKASRAEALPSGQTAV